MCDIAETTSAPIGFATSRLSTGALGEPDRMSRRNGQVFGLAGQSPNRAGAYRPSLSGDHPSAFDGFRSGIPLRDSSGFTPDSLLRPTSHVGRGGGTCCVAHLRDVIRKCQTFAANRVWLIARKASLKMVFARLQLGIQELTKGSQPSLKPPHHPPCTDYFCPRLDFVTAVTYVLS